MSEKILQTTKLFKVLSESKDSVKVLQGGMGSSKTYQILIYIIWNCLENWKNETIDIVRRTMPAMSMGAMKDFFDIIKKQGIYDISCHNRTHNTYQLKTNLIRFYASDDEQKVRGPRRDRTYFNEVLEMKKMDVMQIMKRTRKENLFDYNPSEEFHWFYDTILTRQNILFNISTYKDNPFLSENERKEIELLEDTDKNLWRIYGLGQRGVTEAIIYPNWHYAINKSGRDVSFEEFEGEELFGLDLGFNHPCALVRVKYRTNEFISDELLYKKELTGESLLIEFDKLREIGKLTFESEIWCDNSRPEIIKTLREAGYNVHATKKGVGSVITGIDFIKRQKHYVTKDSINIVKELRTYRWKLDKDDHVIDEPIKIKDDLMDAIRYALEKKIRRKKEIGVA